MTKGTSWAEVTNSKKIKLTVSAIVELCLCEGVRQLVSQSVENSVE